VGRIDWFVVLLVSSGHPEEGRRGVGRRGTRGKNTSKEGIKWETGHTGN
jgi:hypothetical protein